MDDGASTLMSIRDAAQATGLSPKALRRRIERGTLASVMIGGRRRIPMEALARRGLIASGHDPVSGHLLLDRTSPAVEAVAQHLYRLESRVAALEAALGVSLRGEPADADGSDPRVADADGSDPRVAEPVATRRTEDAERYPPAPVPGEAVDRHALGLSHVDGGERHPLAANPAQGSGAHPLSGGRTDALGRHAIITTAPVADRAAGGKPAVADGAGPPAPAASDGISA